MELYVSSGSASSILVRFRHVSRFPPRASLPRFWASTWLCSSVSSPMELYVSSGSASSILVRFRRVFRR
ncbi:MAG TPA: hypothetical protein PLF40_04845, partial [Kofleriaceae bacterium]|nr:hypothetical protein [Kofleriaceae bacterium]